MTLSRRDFLNRSAAAGAGVFLVNSTEGREGLVYDPGVGAGCTIVETDSDGRRLNEFVGIAGTSTNCAGGVTSWGTRLTCEETEDRVGQTVLPGTTATSSRYTHRTALPTATRSRSKRSAASRTRPLQSTRATAP